MICLLMFCQHSCDIAEFVLLYVIFILFAFSVLIFSAVCNLLTDVDFVYSFFSLTCFILLK